MSTHRTPGAVRAGMLAVSTSGVAVALLATMPPLPAEVSLAAADRWWVDLGTGAAAMVLVQLTAVGLAAWIALAATISLAAGLHPSRVLLGLRRLVCRPVLHQLVGGAVLFTAATPVALAGADDDLVLVDLGPVHPVDDLTSGTEPVLLVDLGPVPGSAPPALDESAAPPVDDPAEAPVERGEETWTVQRGDHLWQIATETVEDHGSEATEANVAAYWRQLIDANRDLVGDDPDLIHPGQVIRLPEWVRACS